MRRGGRLPRGMAPAGMPDGATPAALHAGCPSPRDRLRRPSPRRKASERPASEAGSPRPSGVRTPSRVQRRGVEKTRARPRQWPSRVFSGRRTVGRESRSRRASRSGVGTTRPRAPGKAYLRAARQRREAALRLASRYALIIPKYRGFNEGQETPPVFRQFSLPDALRSECN